MLRRPVVGAAVEVVGSETCAQRGVWNAEGSGKGGSKIWARTLAGGRRHVGTGNGRRAVRVRSDARAAAQRWSGKGREDDVGGARDGPGEWATRASLPMRRSPVTATAREGTRLEGRVASVHTTGGRE